MTIKQRYRINKDSAVGAECICPSCGTIFEKTNYQQSFCKSKGGTKCKDKYWNTVDPKKRNNTTRISPASVRYMERNGLGEFKAERDENFDEDQSWDAHKDYF